MEKTVHYLETYSQNQNTEAEIDRAFVETHHINVVRRSTGGGRGDSHHV